MKKICTRILAFMMIMILTFGSGSISVLAETVSENQMLEEEPVNDGSSDSEDIESDYPETDLDDENELTIEGDDSFGSLLAEAVEMEMASQEENLGYHVFSIEMDGKKATVSFETMEDAALVVGIYDESGKKLLASGYTKVTKEDTQAVIDISIDSMPQYFYLRGFLVNADTLRPLCIVYESPNYTREMQEFLSKTTADFDADRVLNLDNDNTNNFAVYEEDTVVLEQGAGSTNITGIDEENNVYIFEHADEEIKSLSVGDVFVYEYDDGTVLIIKVGNIRINGDTVTLKGAQTSLDEVFEFVKIDESAGMEEADVDADFHEEGITYLGKGSETFQEEGVLTPEAEIEVSKEITSTFELAERKIEKEGNNGKVSATISGSIDLSVEASLKVQITRSYQYLEIKLDYSAGIKGTVSGEAEGSIPLPKFGFRLMPGVYIEFAPAIVLRVDGKIEVNGKLSGSIGYKVSNKKGAENISKAPAFSMKLKADATIFVGISMEPKIKILSDKVAKASLKATVGLEIKGELVKPDTSDSEVRHECKNCIDGDISKKLEISFEVQFLNKEGLKWSGKIDKTKKTDDFYYSLDYDEYGFGTCPHEKYRVQFVVVGIDGKAVKDAEVQINGVFQNTDGNGSLNAYLRRGNYKVKVKKSGYDTESMDIRIKGGAKYKVVIFSSINGNNGDSEVEKRIKSVVCNGNAVAVLTESNSLYMWGDNKSGQLGDGTFVDRYIPTKILDNIEAVQISHVSAPQVDGYTTAALSRDGILYMWGNNSGGHLGNETYTDRCVPVPVKVITNIKSFQSGYTTVAIDKDDNLYTWGDNWNGQLGNGTNTRGVVPEKILNNINYIYNGSTMAAIDKVGNLYMWGDNMFGELGDETSSDSNLPQIVIGNIRFVNIGERNTAVITKNNDLYMWGDNYWGQAGTGEFTPGGPFHSSIIGPTKILENVESVHMDEVTTAAIMKDGSLYTWGCNSCGMLGNGETDGKNAIPTKIMENIKSIQMYSGGVAAITKDNNLYMWGDNNCGQVGNGMTEDVCTPTKIMENVESIQMHTYRTAVITKDGSLYMWGDNSCGQLGNGTKRNSNIPIKIMDNVLLVNVQDSYSVAVTKDGNLYAWGDNSCGQLGNGTKIDSLVPIKIELNKINSNSIESVLKTEAISDVNNTFPGAGTFTSILPNETYNFYVMKSQNADEVFDTDNLLYIGQGKSDANGNLNITYETKETYDGAVSFAVGMTTPDISGATINVSNLAYNGKEQYIAPVVTYKGTTLTEGKDYILTGDFRAKDVGNYQFGILGIGMFAGEKKANYSVTGETVKKITSITLDQTSIEMTVGTKRTLTANIQPQNASNKAIRWESDDPSVATIDSNGNITAIRRGQTTIKATTNDGSNLTAQCVVYVKPDENDIPEGPKTWEGKTGTEGFVYRLYNVAMSREADESGFRDWNGKLQRREQSAAEVARGFIFSKEFMNRCYNDVQYVKILYRTMFGREADEGGLNDWLSKLENGMSREYVFRGFAESQEFSNLCDSYGVLRGSITLSAYRDQNVGATGFIARLYTKMLGRGFDDDGLEYWCRKYLTGENTIEEVATVGFLHSQELKNLNLSDTEFVTRMYRTFLNREPDEAGLADWVNRLETGRETRDSLVYGFTLSKEFGNIKASYGL